MSLHDDLVRAKKYTGPLDEKDATARRCCIVCDIVRAMTDEDIAALAASPTVGSGHSDAAACSPQGASGPQGGAA